MLPSVTFAHSAPLGGARRFLVSMLLPIPAVLYVLHLGEPGGADAVSAFMREGGVHLARAFGAAGPGALLVAAVLGTFVIPMLGFALAWTAGRLASAQMLLAWLAQSLVNTCLYLIGDVYAPAALGISPSLRVPGMAMLGLSDVSIAVGGGFFLLGAALFVVTLLLPMRFGVYHPVQAPVQRQEPLYV